MSSHLLSLWPNYYLLPQILLFPQDRRILRHYSALFFFFNWNVVVLQRCANSCSTAKWFIYTYLFHYGLSQVIEYSSLYCTLGPWLFISSFLKLIYLWLHWVLVAALGFSGDGDGGALFFLEDQGSNQVSPALLGGLLPTVPPGKSYLALSWAPYLAPSPFPGSEL